jgi:hypothetical protein
MRAPLRLWPKRVAGIECPFPVVRLRVRDRYGLHVELDFRVDTQADFTAIPIATARHFGIPFSETQPRAVHGLVGQTVAYRDRVRIVIAGREHAWPCEFVRTVFGEGGSAAADMRPVLGRAGFLDEYAITVDSGFLIVTRIGPVRRRLRRWLHALWDACGLIHQPDDPL